MSPSPETLQFDSFAAAATPRLVHKLTKILGILFFGVPLFMLFLPWQQNITALGAVTAFAPLERRQTVDAPVSGRIEKWYVQEGSVVKAGEVLLEITDVDPLYKERLLTKLEASKAKLEAKEEELRSYQHQLQSLITARDAKVSAAQYKYDMAGQKVLAATEAVASAQATLDTATFQVQRLQRLISDGLVSKRDVEVAERDSTIAQRNLNSAQAQLASAKAEQQTASVEIQQIRADAQASISSATGVINKLRAEITDSQNSLVTAETDLSRQQAQKLVAPRDGTVFRLQINSQSQMVSQGEPLLVIIPDTNSRAVELMVDGKDAPLILPGSKVRLEFEGWPAIQFSGWPDVALGTFGGKVAFVDASDDGMGHFRVMVVPDESRQKWPSERFLRQGVSARGWVLLEEVTIGYEIWRILNGFPPRLTQPTASAQKALNKPS